MSPTNRTQLKLESLDDRIVPTVVDLTAAGSFGSVNGAIAHRVDSTWAANNGDQSHGTGPLQVVLGVNHTGTETGYNTTATPIQTGMDTTFAQALTLSQVPVVTVNGNQYYEFVLNTNEPTGGRKLTVENLQLFVSNVSNLANYNSNKNTLGTLANKVSPVYDLDAGDATNALLVKSKTNVSAAGEIAVLVPIANFASASPSSFVYIYTKITGAAGGDEQWGVRSAPVVAGPASLSGQIYLDTNGNGTYEVGTDTALSGTFTFIVTDPNNNDTQYTTNSDGSFSLTGLAAGTYQILIFDQEPYFSETGIVGTGNGVNDGEAGSNVLLNIELSAGENGTGYGFLMGQSGT
jgi:hypothetical protein